MDWIVHPAPPPVGTLDVPGDKSISHRVAMLASLARGTSRITGFLAGEDCLRTLAAMQAMGAGVRRSGATVEIAGTGGALRSPAQDLDMGNSGTGMRLMTGLLAGFPVEARLVGDASLSRRPMRRILDPLRRMGAEVAAEGADGCAPLRVRGGTLAGVDFAMPVASAQVKSCLLLAGLRARGTTRVVEPLPSRDHTERMFRVLGLPLRVEGATLSLEGTGGAAPAIPARDWSVPGDISSAAFWFVAAAIRPGARVTVRRLGLNPSRTAFLDALRAMGASVMVGPLHDADWEPQADVTVVGGALRGVELCGATIPNLIDELPVLCVAAAFAQGTTRVRDAAELRVKESDRIATTAALLRTVGVRVATLPNGLDVQGGATPCGGVVDSHGDHRIAMSAAVLALSAAAPLVVRDTACVATSYPEFAAHLERLAPGALAFAEPAVPSAPSVASAADGGSRCDV